MNAYNKVSNVQDLIQLYNQSTTYLYIILLQEAVKIKNKYPVTSDSDLSKVAL